MKLLTNIFRARQARAQPTKGHLKANHPQVDQGDVHMVNFLLTEFRRHIIPQTCALIFLQGQIRAGHAQPEDFPLNLWDMERMYEGVYQYLEFFAILTEHETWKRMLSNWEISHELVTLLKELDAAIPKGQLSPPPLRNVQHAPPPPAPVEVDIPSPQQHQDPQQQQPQPQPVAVERPYDTTAGAAEPYMPPPTSPSPRPYMDEAADEPSDFEWRNLKKLAVLVLSSLVWKNKHVQDQIRPLGGIEAVLNCCSYDEHNPYIREHAIMCLRFLMEGNKENQDRIHALEKYNQDANAKAKAPAVPMTTSSPSPNPTAAVPGESSGSGSGSSNRSPVNVRVPDEVLDQQGYETYMDKQGQVMLRKRQHAPQPSPSPQHPPHQNVPLTSRADNGGSSNSNSNMDQNNSGSSSNSSNAKGKTRAEYAQSAWDSMRATALGGIGGNMTGVAGGVRDPKALEEMVERVMHNLPRLQGLRGGEERAVEVEEALKKLDKGFDGGS
jgi:palmitoyltransferase